MKVNDAIAEIMKREGAEFLSCFPTTTIIDAAAQAGIRPVVCRQERVGVGIADGYSRATNGKRLAVFAMQYGPGAENAFSGVATAYSDSTPVLLLPLGHRSDRSGVRPYFSSARTYEPVTKWVERVNLPGQVPEAMRRAISLLRAGKPGPVMLEIPADVANQETGPFDYRPVTTSRPAGDPRDIEKVAELLLKARCPVIHAGQGVLYAEAWDELVELAELMQAPVMTTLLGKSVFPEDHPLALGTAARTVTGPIKHFLDKADVIFGIGCSFSRHGMSTPIPPGKVLVHATADADDINKNYYADYQIVGDARLVLRQFIEAIKERLGKQGRKDKGDVAQEIKKVKEEWMKGWMVKLTSDEVPLNAYRVIWDLIHTLDPKDGIVTHDAGSPRDQLVPFYPATAPRSYLGWGKSHGLGTGLGLIMGAKLAKPEKITINFMGDAAFGMVGTDFETAARNKIPIITVVLNNFTMAIERGHMDVSHELYSSRDLGGNYADMGTAMNGYGERVEKPSEIAPAFRRAIKANQEGRPALLEFITGEEITFSLP